MRNGSTGARRRGPPNPESTVSARLRRIHPPRNQAPSRSRHHTKPKGARSRTATNARSPKTWTADLPGERARLRSRAEVNLKKPSPVDVQDRARGLTPFRHRATGRSGEAAYQSDAGREDSRRPPRDRSSLLGRHSESSVVLDEGRRPHVPGKRDAVRNGERAESKSESAGEERTALHPVRPQKQKCRYGKVIERHRASQGRESKDQSRDEEGGDGSRAQENHEREKHERYVERFLHRGPDGDDVRKPKGHGERRHQSRPVGVDLPSEKEDEQESRTSRESPPPPARSGDIRERGRRTKGTRGRAGEERTAHPLLDARRHRNRSASLVLPRPSRVRGSCSCRDRPRRTRDARSPAQGRGAARGGRGRESLRAPDAAAGGDGHRHSKGACATRCSKSSCGSAVRKREGIGQV